MGFPKICLLKVFLDFLGLFIKFWKGHVQKSRNHRNEGFEDCPISKSKSDKFKLEQNNTTELLNRSFAWIHYTNCSESQNISKILFVLCFSGFFRLFRAGVGVCILRGFVVSWKSERFKNLIVPKYQDSRQNESTSIDTFSTFCLV